MKERPILFTGPMVRAVLAGTKRQTRRVFKKKNGGVYPNRNDLPGMQQIQRNCPYGQSGDRLWVRETFARIDGQTRPWIETDYRATYKHGYRLGDTLGIKKRWTPAIHMPRHASRITLCITAVRVERLQEITEIDAIAEGVEPNWIGDLKVGPNGFGGEGWVPACGWKNYLSGVDGEPAYSAVESYRTLWAQIHGADSWADNPWVWVVDFEQLAMNAEVQP